MISQILNNELAHSLPPNVNGRCRGQLIISIKNIHWFNDTERKFANIQVQIMWWGEFANDCRIIR